MTRPESMSATDSSSVADLPSHPRVRSEAEVRTRIGGTPADDVRLVHLAGYGGPYPGSFIPMLRAALRAARARGWKAEVVFSAVAKDRPWLAEFHADDVPVRFAPEGSRRELVSWLDESLPGGGRTLLHSHFTVFDVAVARLARRRPSLAAVWHLHTPLPRGLGGRTRNLAKFVGLGRDVERILCVSPALRASAVRRGAPARRTTTLLNGIDPARFPLVAEPERSAARRALGLPIDRPVLLHLGWSWHRKGGDLFLNALDKLDPTMNVVGVTVGATGEAADLARACGAVVAKPRPDVRTFYAAADILLAPSRAEGLPFSVMEALASGTAVVASDIPAHGIIDGQLGAYRLSDLDGDSVSTAAHSLLARPPQQVAGDSREARRWISENLSLDRWASELMEVYREVLVVD